MGVETKASWLHVRVVVAHTKCVSNASSSALGTTPATRVSRDIPLPLQQENMHCKNIGHVPICLHHSVMHVQVSHHNPFLTVLAPSSRGESANTATVGVPSALEKILASKAEATLK